ncbi:MAG: hypothetical protein V4582_06025 [Pseudomonadota bacterium]
MKLKIVFATLMLAASQLAYAAAPTAAHIKAVHDLLAAMKTEFRMNATAGRVRYASDQQRKDVYAVLAKHKPEEIHTRLAKPVAALVTQETAEEMTKFYLSSYGQKILKDLYNSSAQFAGGSPGSAPTAAEKAMLKNAAFVKADKALKDVDGAIDHEAFLLLQQLINEK